VMHVTNPGVIDWAMQLGNSSSFSTWGIAPDGSGGHVVTGEFHGTSTLGSVELTSSGIGDVFVFNLGPHTTSTPALPPPLPPASPPPTPLVTAHEAKPLCAGPTELCYLDVRCHAPWTDPWGGLGCNAGGQGQQYRFCGFGPFPPCPGPPKWIVALTSIIAGSIDTFDPPAYQASLRSLLSLEDETLIALNVTAASVRVEAGIVLKAEADATAASTALSAMDTSSLSAGLGVSVAAVEAISSPLAFIFGSPFGEASPASVTVEPGGSIRVKMGGTLTIGADDNKAV